MGRPKLLLPIHGQTLIAHVVTALREGGAERVVVVAPPADSEEGPAVARAAEGAGALVIAPDERPAEMRDSIEIGLAAAARPEPPERVLLSPGDAAGITPGDVAALLEASCRGPGKIVVPRCWRAPGAPAGAAVETRHGDWVAAGRGGGQRASGEASGDCRGSAAGRRTQCRRHR